eukprot:TRINITY_DN717_c0_g1_i1.p1 TRINITY_DN717_c0_g1~~TRINITY_DN717_c0_g1_i1.p1  ORF type:complete len:1331 (+),score=277.23 TRINITY_DN717_c0_g1_i1:128-3994(+)
MAASNWTNPSHPSSSGLGRAPAASSPPSTAGARPVESPRGQSPTGAGLNFGDAMMLGSSTSGQPAYRVRSTVPSASGRGGLDKPFLGPDDDGTPTTEMRPLRQSNASAVGRTRTDSQKAGALYRGAQAGVLVLADLPDPLRQALSEFDFNGDGTVDAPEIYAAGRRHRASRSQKPQYQLDAFPEALHGALKAFDTDGDGSVSAAELAQAAQLYEEAKNTQKKLWRTVFGLMGMLVLLFAALLGLVILAIELSKETETQGSGVMTVKGSTNPVQTAQQLVEVPLGALPHLGMKFLQKVDAIVAQNKHTGDVYRLTVAEGDISKNTTGALATLYTSRGMVAKVMDLLHVRIYTDVKNDKWFPVCGPCSKCSGLSVLLDSEQQTALDKYMQDAEAKLKQSGTTSPCGQLIGAPGAAGRRLHPLEVHARLPCGDRCFGQLAADTSADGAADEADTSGGIAFCKTQEDHRAKTVKATTQHGQIDLMVHRSATNHYKGCLWFRRGDIWTVTLNTQTACYKYKVDKAGDPELIGCMPDPFGPFADPSFMENLFYGQVGGPEEDGQERVELDDVQVANGDYDAWMYEVPAHILAACHLTEPSPRQCEAATKQYGIETMVTVDKSDGQDVTSPAALGYTAEELAAHEANVAALNKSHGAELQKRLLMRRAKAQVFVESNVSIVGACSSRAWQGEGNGVIVFPPGTWAKYCSYGQANKPCWLYSGTRQSPMKDAPEDTSCDQRYRGVCRMYMLLKGQGSTRGAQAVIVDHKWFLYVPSAKELMSSAASATGRTHVCGWPPDEIVNIYDTPQSSPCDRPPGEILVGSCRIGPCDSVDKSLTLTPSRMCANNTCCGFQVDQNAVPDNNHNLRIMTLQCPTDETYSMNPPADPQAYCQTCQNKREPRITNCSQCLEGEGEDSAVERFLEKNPNYPDAGPYLNATYWLRKTTTAPRTKAPTLPPTVSPSASPSQTPSSSPTTAPSASPVSYNILPYGGEATSIELWKVALAAYGVIPGRSVWAKMTPTVPPPGWSTRTVRCVNATTNVRVEFLFRGGSPTKRGSFAVSFAMTEPISWWDDIRQHRWTQPELRDQDGDDEETTRVNVHGGWLEMVDSVKDCVLVGLEYLKMKDELEPDYFVGHSLGGAVATIFKQLYFPDGPRLGVHTFGAPPTRYVKRSSTRADPHCLTNPVPGVRYFIQDDPIASEWTDDNKWWHDDRMGYVHDVARAVKLYTEVPSSCAVECWWWSARCCKKDPPVKRFAELRDEHCSDFSTGSICASQKYNSITGVHWKYKEYLQVIYD